MGATGSASVTVHGSNFGLVHFTGASRIGLSACETTDWVSDSSLVCRVPQGIQGTRLASVTAGERSGTLTEAYSFDLPSLSVIQRLNRALIGTLSLTLSGTNFGLLHLSGVALVGLSACEASDWVSDTSLVCRVSHGVRGTRLVSVTAGEQVGTLTEAYSFDAPSLSVSRGVNWATTGSSTFTMHGSSFGNVGFTRAARVGPSACEASGWVSDTSLVCRVSHGVQGTLLLSLTAGEQASTSTEAYSFDMPSLNFIRRVNLAASGSASVTVHGSNFGSVHLSGLARAGLSACEASDWVSDTSLICRMSHGVRGMRIVSVTAAELPGTLTEAYSFNVPSMSAIRRANSGSTGSVSVTVHGSNLGTVSSTDIARAGLSACEASDWVSDTSLVCRVSHGLRGTRLVTLTAGERSGTMTETYSFDVPSLSVIRGVNGGTTGSVSVTVHGSNFGKVQFTGDVRVGLSACEASDWVSDTSLTCLVSRGVRGNLQVSLTAGERSGTLTEAYSFNVPSSYAARGANWGATGSVSVTVYGTNFGDLHFCGAARVGLSACEASDWVSDTTLLCRVMHGVRGTRLASVTAGDRVTTLTEAYSFDVPRLSMVRKLNGGFPGSASVTVHGSNFGLVHFTGVARVGMSACEASGWVSDTSLICRVSHGVRGTRLVSVTAGDRVTTLTEAYSFDVPRLSMVRKLNGGFPGSASVTVHGSNFGLVHFTGVARVGMSACEASDWVSDTSLICRVSHGVRGTRLVSVTAGDRSGTLTEAYSFDVPSLSGMRRANMGATGSASVTVHGSNFGLVHFTGASRIGLSACETTDWVSDSSLVCRVPQGIQGTRLASVTAGERSGTLTEAYSFDLPSLSVIQRLNRALIGTLSLTLSGTNFGLLHLSGVALVGLSACEASDWVSDTSLVCRVSHGVRGTRLVSVTAGEQVGTLTEAYSFDAPSLSVSRGVNWATTGSSTFTMHGSSFGNVGFTGAARVGPSACEASGWVSDTSLVCRVSHGVQGTLLLSLTAGEQASTSTEAYSFDMPSLNFIRRVNLAASGSASVTVHGSNFGSVHLSGLARAGLSACEASDWVSDTSLICRVSHGVRGMRIVSVTAAELPGTLTEAYSFNVPSMSAIRRANSGSTGSVSVTVHGSNLGTVSSTDIARAGLSACEASDWVSDTSLVCRVSQGLRGTRLVTLTAGERSGTMTETYSFDVPSLSVIRGVNGGTTGSVSVTVHGSNFGKVQFTGDVRVGLSACEASDWVSDTSLTCLVSRGVRGNLQVSLTAGERSGTLTEAYSFNVPSSYAARGANWGATGSVSVTVYGTNFGDLHFCGAARVGLSACEASDWVSDTTLLCRVMHGVWGTRLASVTVGDRVTTLTEAYSFDVPRLSMVRKLNGGFPGSASVTVHGSNFGLVHFTGVARVGMSACEASGWVSDTSLICRVSHGVRGTRLVSVTAGDRVTTLTEAYSFDVPRLSMVWKLNGGFPGSASVTVHGSNFGLVHFTGVARVGMSACEASGWVSDTSLICRVSHGVRGTRLVSVTAGDRSGTLTEAYSFDVPSLSGMRRANMGATGSASVTVHGSNFGLVHFTGASRIGLSACETTDWVSDSSLVCRVPQGIQGTRLASVTAGERSGTLTEAYSFDLPSLSVIQRLNRALIGTLSLTLSGTNFGLLHLSGVALVGLSACEASDWVSDTSLVCRVSHGVRGTRLVSVTAGDRVGSLTEAFSFDGPSLSATQPVNSVVTGSVSVIVHVSNFGSVHLSGLARAGLSACEASDWVSDTSLVCRVSHGVRGTQLVSVTAGEESGTLTQAYSFDIPSLSLMLSANRGSTGSVSVTVHGSNFGIVHFTGAARVGFSACEASDWLSDTSLVCRTSHELRGTRQVSLTAGERSGTLTEVYSFDAPSLNIAPRANRAATGSSSITVHGSNFGNAGFTGATRVEPSACEASSWESDTSLVCRVSHGVRGTLQVSVTGGLQAGTMTEAYSFDVPSLSVVRRLNRASTGSASVTVHGSNFGRVIFSGVARAGLSACEASGWVSDTSLVCRVSHGIRGTRLVSVTSGERSGTLTEAFSFDTPSSSLVSLINQPVVGSVIATVFGSDFGVASFTDSTRLGLSACELTEWQSDTSVRCKGGPGIRGTQLVTITAGERSGTVTEIYSYDTASLSSVTQVNRAATGSASVTVSGLNFGSIGYTALTRLGRSACEASDWASDTSLVCRVSHGVRGTLLVSVTAGEQVGTFTEAYSFDAPSLSVIRRANQAAVGSSSITVHGSSFGNVGFTGAARVGPSACEASDWVSDTSLVCRVSYGERSLLQVSLTAGAQSGTFTEAHSFDSPSLNVVRCANRAATGSSSVTIYGSNFGYLRLTGIAKVGPSACEASDWVSDTSLICRVSHGVRGTLQVSLTSGVQAGTIIEAYSFDVPSLSVVRQANRAATGSSSITVHGSNFASVGFTAASRVGPSACEASDWVSDTSLVCRVSHGVRGTRRVSVTGGVRVGSLTEAYSFDVPSLSVVRQANRAATGSSSITVHGSNFASVGFTAASRVGPSACEASDWVSDTSLVCRVSHGVRGTRRVSVTGGVRVGSLTEAYSFDVPSLSVVRQANRAATGSSSITVHGSNFASVGFTAASRVGPSACEASDWVSDTSLVCRVSHGVRGTRRVSVTGGVRVGSLTEAYSFDVPSLSVVRQANRAATGSSSITVHGSNFASVGFTAASRVGPSACEASDWVSDTSLVCRVSHGVRGTRRVSVTGGVRVGSLTEAYSFDVPSLSVVRQANRAATGSSSITVHGSNFASVGFTAASRVGPSACEASDWVSDTSLVCRVSHGVRGTRRVSVTGGVRVGSLTEVYSFDVPSLSVVRQANRAATGSSSITVHGSNFASVGFTAASRVGPSACEASDWVSDTSLVCRVSHGVRGTRRVSVTGGVRVGSLTEAYSFDVPSLSVVRQANRAATGSSSITVHGSNFASVGFTAASRVGPSACEASDWVSDTSLVCRVSHGVRGTRRVSVTGGVRVGSLTEAYSFDVPSLSVVRQANRAATGSSSITVHGSNFASVGFTAASRVGPSACEASDWVSDTSLVCRVSHGVRGTRRVSVTGGVRVGSLTEAYSFDVPSLSVVRRANRAATGSSSITVHGSNFASVGFTAASRVGPSACEASDWVSDTSLVCRVSHGVRGTRRVSVTGGVRVGSLTEAYSFDVPSLSVVRQANRAATGSSSITVHGSNFASVGFTAASRVGPSACEASDWVSDTSLVCRVSHGVRGTRRVSVTGGVRVGSLTEAYSFDVPSLSVVRQANRAATGSSSITVHGSNFASVGFTAASRVGPSACEASDWVSDTSLVCRVSHGVRGTRRVSVTGGVRVGSLTEAYSFDVPSLSVVRRASRAATGSSSITVHGSNFASVGFTAASRVGPSACEASDWVSDTSLVCRVSHGVRGTRRVSVTGGVRVGSLTEAYSFDVPSLSVVRQANRAATGSSSITVHGSNFASVGFTAASRVGPSACEASDWVSDTSLVCRVSHGVRGTRRVSVTGGVRVGSLVQAYSFDVPSLSVVRQANRAATGSSSITVHGSNFASVGFTAASRVGPSACKASDWVSDTSLVCRVSHGVRGTRRVSVTGGVRVGSLTEAYSFDVPSLSVVRRANRAATGSSSITVHGSDFASVGFTAASRVGPSACEASDWVSDTSLVCRVSHGVRGTRRVSVTGGLRVGSISEAFSFDASSISSVGPASVGLVSSIALSGVDFGSFRASVEARMGLSACEGTVWVSDTSVLGQFAGGTGGSRRVSVTGGIRVGTLTEAVSYGLRGTIASSVSAANRLTSGSVSLTVSGSDFGVAAESIKGRVGLSACEATDWVSDSSLKCKSGRGMAGTRRVSVTGGALVGTLTKAVSYDSSSLSSIGVANVQAVGSVSVTVSGLDFGSFRESVKARMGLSGCEATDWVSDISVLCLAGRGVGATRRVSVTGGALVGTLTKAVSYDSSSLSSIGVANVQTVGSVSVTVSGLDFGSFRESVKARMGLSGCEATDWVSDISVLCLAGRGVGATRRVSVTGGVRVGSISEALSYDTLTVSSVSPPNHPATGLTSMTVFGSDFGNFGSSPAGRIETACSATDWVSYSSCTCKVSPGGATLQESVVVTTGMRVGTLTLAMTYDTPVSSILPANIPLSGAFTATISGSSFGVNDYTDTGRIGLTACEATIWLSDSTVLSKVPAGLGATLSVMVTIGGAIDTLTEALTYDSVHLFGVVKYNLRHSSDSLVTVHGTDFSVRGMSIAARLGPSACEATLWMSQTSVVCKVIAGAGGSRTVSITGGVRVSTISKALSYDSGLLSVFSLVNVAASGGQVVSVYGSAFGIADLSLSVRVLATSCEASVWISESSLRCKVPSGGPGLSGSVTLTLGGQVATITHALTYDSGVRRVLFDAPTISLRVLGAANVPSSGGFKIMVIGEGQHLSASLRAGATACEVTAWVSDTSIECRAARGVGRSLGMTLSVGIKVDTVARVWTYDAPVGLATPVPVMKGATAMTLLGTSFGPVDHTLKARLLSPNGSTSCSSTSWISHSSIVCRFSFPSVHALLRDSVSGSMSTTFVITLASRVSTITQLLWYDTTA